MTRTLLTLTMCLCSIMMQAQWSKIDNFAANGRPASALAEAKRIYATAKTPGERMQALLCMGQMQQELTPDSFFAHFKELMQWHCRSANCAERAVTAITMARLLDTNAWRSQYRAKASAVRSDDMRLWSQADYSAMADSLRTVAWSQPFDSLHVVKAKAWTPYVELASEGRDVLSSRWWDEDLLHIVLADAPDSVWTRAKTFYATRGLREPAVEDYIRRCRDSIDVCRQGIEQCKGEKRVVVLQNELMRIECPELEVGRQEIMYPGRSYSFNVEAKNVSQFTLTEYSISKEPDDWNLVTIRKVGKPTHRNLPAVSVTQPRSSATYAAPSLPGLYALVITPTPTREVKRAEPIVMPIRVSRNQLLHLQQADGAVRFLVVDALSGQPAEGISIQVSYDRDKHWTAKTDSRGRTSEFRMDNRRYWNARAKMVGDASPEIYVHTNTYEQHDNTTAVHAIYTDRRIYRPGQTVNYGLISYTRSAKTAKVHADEKIIVDVTTPRRDKHTSDTITTDHMGVASGSFTIPADAQPGMWHLSPGRGKSGGTSFRVEEYKRPTFAVEMEQVDTPLVIRLNAKSFAGTPVSGARVTGDYTINQAFWWRRHSSFHTSAQIDTIMTDASGNAIITIPMPKVETRFAVLSLTAHVTSASGETHSQSLRLPLRRNELSIQASVPSVIERSNIAPFDVRLVDATDREVAGDIACTITPKGKTGTQSSQVALSALQSHLAQLPSGRYDIVFSHGETQSEHHPFTLFALSDTQTPDTAHYYATSDTLPCTLHFGSCLDGIAVFVYAYDGTHQRTDTIIYLNNAARTLQLQPATHSDGLSVTMTFVKGEEVNTFTHTFFNPQPDHRLRWHWDTFRDHTSPGSHERWSGTLLRPDGTPAPANVMLTIYDASLDAITPHSWHLDFAPTISVSHCAWSHLSRVRQSRYSSDFTLPLLREPSLVTHRFSDKYLNGFFAREENMLFDSAPMMVSSRSMAKGVSLQARQVMTAAPKAMAAMVSNEAVEEEAGGEAPTAQPDIRQDFSEQAIFVPALRTDAAGRFTLDFTLPHSVTTWQLLGVAHTADLMTATTRRQCVAQKDVMLQLSVPRFMRLGDKGTATVTIHNLTAETVKARLETTVTDGSTTAQPTTFTLEAKRDTVIVIAIDATTVGEMVVRAVATADKHSDGEQRTIPVIDTRTWVTETVDLATDGAAASFTVPAMPQAEEERSTLTFNPAPIWTAISALPAMMTPDDASAISLANAYFATTLTRHLATSVPAIQERRRFPLDSLLTASNSWHTSLSRLQKDDGSFAWFPGGFGSTFITTEVVVELARLAQLTGVTSPLLNRALNYLSQQTDKRIAEMKKHNVKVADDYSFFYLYATALLGRKATQADFLLPLIAKQLTSYSINSRALAAVIFRYYNKEKEANRFLTSLDEHIVTAPHRGSYFDYPGGSFTSIDRKLQTLTTAIEAKSLLADTLHLRGLRRNLLQQRRVQGWESKLFATAAVAAILTPSLECTMHNAQCTINVVDNEKMRSRYVITTDTTIALGSTPSRIDISRQGGEDSEGWGALFVHRLMTNGDVAASHTGLQIRTEVPAQAKVGDRLTLRYIITADRDYEWVRLTAPRAACFEPTQQLSGYRHQGGLSYYLSQRDTGEDFFFERVPRGTYIITSEVYADRRGSYTTGIASIECLYAPEYTGHTADTNIVIE